MSDVLPGVEADRAFLEGEFGLELPPVPSPSSTGASFELDEEQLAEIAAASGVLDDLGDAIVSSAPALRQEG